MDDTHQQNVARSIALARENARANRPRLAIGGDRATQTVREQATIRKWASEESKALGEPPYETNVTTVESVVDKKTGEVLDCRIVSPDEIPEVPQVPIDM